MADTYVLDFSDPAKTPITVAPPNVDESSTSISLIGETATVWGERINENQLHQLENFAKSTAPANPIEGQLWYDNNLNQVNVYNGASWDQVGGGAVGGASGTTGDAPFDRTTVLTKRSFQTIPNSIAPVAVTWTYVEHDPFNLYGGGGASINTSDILAPAAATRFRAVTTLIVEQHSGTHIGTGWFAMTVANDDFKIPAGGGFYSNYGHRTGENNAQSYGETNANWGSTKLSWWQSWVSPWISLTGITQPWKIDVINGANGTHRIWGSGTATNYSTLTIEYDFS